MSSDDAAIGLDSAAPRSTMPYSVSMPQTLRMAIAGRPYPLRRRMRAALAGALQVLASADPFDGPAALGFLAFRHEGAHVHDALALLARDLGPVVGVRRVGQVFVLLVLLL